jgi:hypothetical protein
MAKLRIGDERHQGVHQAFLDAMPRIRGFVEAYHRRHPDLERLILDVQELAYYYARRKYKPGEPVRLDFHRLCRMAIADRGLGNLTSRKRLRAHSDSRLLHRVAARQAQSDLEVDLRQALGRMTGLPREIIGLKLQGYQWKEICRALKTNFWHIQRANQALRQLLADYDR